MTPLERAALALAQQYEARVAPYNTIEDLRQFPADYARFMDAARAVLTSIREPSETMVGPDSKAWWHAGSEAEHVWREAIDAMLGEG